jgi:ketosteroid isomerase-like protein
MSTEKEILALEDRRYAAMTTNDLDALAAMFHDDLVYTHSSSVVDTKPSYLEALRSGKTRYKSAKRFEEKVRFVGDTALVTGRAEMEAEINGNPRSLRLRFLNVWSKTPAGWKFIAWHSCSMPA